MNLQITSHRTTSAIYVLIDGLVHIERKNEGFRFMYSYFDKAIPSENKWVIEFHYIGMDCVEVEYNSEEKWRLVLSELGKYISL